MRFPVRLLASCFLAAHLAGSVGAATVEVAKPGSVPVVVEAIHSPTDLAKLRPLVNRRVVLEGVVLAMAKSRSGATSYLNFTKNYRESVSLVFLASAAVKDFPKERLAEFVGRKIHVGGLLEERNGALQMRVFYPEQIRVLK